MKPTEFLNSLATKSRQFDSRSHELAMDIANTYLANREEVRNEIVTARNTNTISDDLKRIVILQETLSAFERRIISLKAFSTTFESVPLKRLGGKAQVAVPFYPLNTTSSKDFADGTGYEFDQDSQIDSRLITINKRKYKPFKFYSSEFARQPFFNIEKLTAQMAEQLGLDVFLDVMSLVTAENFTQQAFMETPEGFDTDDAITLGGAADKLDWPQVGRNLILDTDYHTNLKKDPALKYANQSGSDQTLREGITGRVDRFDLYECPRIPNNGEALKGMAVFPSAVLVATAPIEPGPGVRKQLVNYSLVVSPKTGISFEYRYWGSADKDEDREIVEVNYGYEKGQDEACIRLVGATG